MSTIKINQQLKRIEIGKFEIENEIVFNYFDKLTDAERDNQLVYKLYDLTEEEIAITLSVKKG